ncbi:unnamed protein product [Schistosoma mattheei]|uniref:Uncharacterized protein n=1 Tax=Schistosoma mattheei TaxID=31246 RepID=A0A183PVT2_9TREM|nr:unnamed protein product [Schistosoma mattheei]
MAFLTNVNDIYEKRLARNIFCKYEVIGCNGVNLCSRNLVNRKEHINDLLMNLLTTTSLSVRDADRILNGFRVLVPDLPRSIRSVLRTQLETSPSTLESKHVGCASAAQLFVLRMATVTRLIDNDPKTSMRYVLSYLMTPEVASNFTSLGTSSKRAIQKCRFYGCIRSNVYLLFKLQVP